MDSLGNSSVVCKAVGGLLSLGKPSSRFSPSSEEDLNRLPDQTLKMASIVSTGESRGFPTLALMESYSLTAAIMDSYSANQTPSASVLSNPEIPVAFERNSGQAPERGAANSRSESLICRNTFHALIDSACGASINPSWKSQPDESVINGTWREEAVQPELALSSSSARPVAQNMSESPSYESFSSQETEESDGMESSRCSNVVVVPSEMDVLIGTGRSCSSHTGNRVYQSEISALCEEYHNAKKKKRVVQRAVYSVRKRGGRFLEKVTEDEGWTVVDDETRLDRNARKSFHMARNQQGKQTGVSSSETSDSMFHSAEEDPNSMNRQEYYDVGENYPRGPTLTLQNSFPVFPVPGMKIAIIVDPAGMYSLGTVDGIDRHLLRVRYDECGQEEWLDLRTQQYQLLSTPLAIVPIASPLTQPTFTSDHETGSESMTEKRKDRPDESIGSTSLAKKHRRAKVSWTTQEDAALRNAVRRFGTDNWSKVSEQMPGRVHWQCRQRWTENLDPEIDDKKPLEPEECRAILSLHREYSNKWTEIARRLPSTRRSTKFVRHKFVNRLRPAVLKYFQIDPSCTHVSEEIDYHDDFEGAVRYVLSQLPKWQGRAVSTAMLDSADNSSE